MADPAASPRFRGFQHVIWSRAWLGMVIAGILALSVHVVMLQVLHVPYPAGYPAKGWPLFLGYAVSAFGFFALVHLCNDSVGRLSFARRWLLLFLLAAMLRESLRASIMDSIATSAWRYSFLSDAPRFVYALLLSLFVALLAPHLRRWWQLPLAALAVAAMLFFVCLPLINRLFAHLLATFASLSHEEIYKPPYDWHIEVPAYITYIEPVLASFVLIGITWERLGRNTGQRTLAFVLLAMTVNIALIRPLVYVFYSSFPPGLALLSMGQFFLEALTLALLMTFVWRSSQASSDRSATPSVAR